MFSGKVGKRNNENECFKKKLAGESGIVSHHVFSTAECGAELHCKGVNVLCVVDIATYKLELKNGMLVLFWLLFLAQSYMESI